MSAPTQAERLIVLETKMDIVISQQKTTNDKLDVLLPTFVTQTEFQQELGTLKRRTWVQNTLSAVLGVVLTLLLSYFITNISK